MGESSEENSNNDESDQEVIVDQKIIVDPQFTDKLYKEVSKDRNVLISPINVEILLGMIYQGAVEETAEKIATVLDVTNKKEAAEKYKREIEKLSGLISLNQIFIKKDLFIKNTFEAVLEDSFKSKVEGVDFSDTKKACNEINQWVEDKTKNKIKDLVSPGSLDDTMGLVLVSAVYFKSTWEIPFLEIDTTIQPFFISENKAVDCEMMFTTGFFKYTSYFSKTGREMIKIPFKGRKISMIIIMLGSTEEDFAETEDSLAKIQLSKLIEDEDEETVQRVELFLPKFKIESTIDIKPLLENVSRWDLQRFLIQKKQTFQEFLKNLFMLANSFRKLP